MADEPKRRSPARRIGARLRRLFGGTDRANRDRLDRADEYAHESYPGFTQRGVGGFWDGGSGGAGGGGPL
jgi:hypothetical protein